MIVIFPGLARNVSERPRISRRINRARFICEVAKINEPMARKRDAEMARRDIARHNFMFSGGRANSKSATHPGTVNPSPGVNPSESAVNPAGLCNAAVFKRRAPRNSRSEDGARKAGGERGFV